jgi:IclR family transcriptional regulator, acetate operon repressor
VQNTSRYQIQSVDNALRLIRMLQAGEVLQVSTVAQHLGVGRSTAHRLLSMLIQHGFAVQGPDREYLRGPSLHDPQAALPVGLSLAELRRRALPILHTLTERTQETTNLQLILGDYSRVVASVESDRPLRVSNREGQYLPASMSSGGRAVRGKGTSVLDACEFAINDQDIEEGITAIGMAVKSAVISGALAVSIAMPSVRFDRESLAQWVNAMAQASQSLSESLDQTVA